MSRPDIGRWTFCGVMAVPGLVLFLVNDSQRSTRALFSYDDAHPVVIKVLP